MNGLEGEITFVSLCTYIITESEDDEMEDLRDRMNYISSIDQPDHLPNQRVIVNIDDPASANISYSDGALERPEPTEYNSFRMSVDPDYDIHVHSDFNPGSLHQMLEHHSQYFRDDDEILMNSCNIYYKTDGSFSDIRVDLDMPEEFSVSGLEVQNEDNDSWIGLRYDDSDDILRITYRYTGEANDIRSKNDLVGFVNNQTDKAIELIEEFNDESA